MHHDPCASIQLQGNSRLSPTPPSHSWTCRVRCWEWEIRKNVTRLFRQVQVGNDYGKKAKSEAKGKWFWMIPNPVPSLNNQSSKPTLHTLDEWITSHGRVIVNVFRKWSGCWWGEGAGWRTESQHQPNAPWSFWWVIRWIVTGIMGLDSSHEYTHAHIHTGIDSPQVSIEHGNI